jgi:hypothetical protein
MAYWYNVDKGTVEDDGNKSPGDQLLGPYTTEDEATRALEHARENTEKWDAEDKAWDDAGLED